MAQTIDFADLLVLLENHGWKLTGIWKPYRIFTKQDNLPILIPVHDKKVDVEYVHRVKEILASEGGGAGPQADA